MFIKIIPFNGLVPGIEKKKKFTKQWVSVTALYKWTSGIPHNHATGNIKWPCKNGELSGHSILKWQCFSVHKYRGYSMKI